MSDISRWLEIVDQLYTRDISGLINTIRSAFSETSNTEDSCDNRWLELPTTSIDLCLFRTAEMMDQPAGDNGVNPPAPPPNNEVPQPGSLMSRLGNWISCFNRTPRQARDDGTSNQQRTDTTPSTNTAPVADNTTPPVNPTSNTETPATVATEDESKKKEEKDAKKKDENKVKNFIYKTGTRTTNKVLPEPVPSTSAPKKTTDTDTSIQGTSGTTEAQGTSGSNQERGPDWDASLDIPSEHGSTDDERSYSPTNSSVQSEESKRSASAPAALSIPETSAANTGNRTDQDNDEGKTKIRGSFGVRDANALYLPEQHAESVETITHSELFGSFNLDHLRGEDSGDWLDYFREEYSEYPGIWF